MLPKQLSLVLSFSRLMVQYDILGALLTSSVQCDELFAALSQSETETFEMNNNKT